MRCPMVCDKIIFGMRQTDKGRLPQAIICGNDNIAVGVCEAATAHGYQVPEDFCVTGFDNFDTGSSDKIRRF